jgi:hypothetical protein
MRGTESAAGQMAGVESLLGNLHEEYEMSGISPELEAALDRAIEKAKTDYNPDWEAIDRAIVEANKRYGETMKLFKRPDPIRMLTQFYD